jgi:hypothetical protein
MLALIGRGSGRMLFGEFVLAHARLAVDESRSRGRQGPQQRRDVGGPLDPLGAHIG